MTKNLNEKTSALSAKEEALVTLQNQIKEKETDVTNTSALTEKLKQELDALTKEKENIIEANKKHIEASKEEYNSELKKKDEVVFYLLQSLP